MRNSLMTKRKKMITPESPCWIYDRNELQNTPSFRHGIDSKTEARYRYQGASFIIDAGKWLGLQHQTIATGAVYFHRFYMHNSFKEFSRYITGCCCLFLAGKVEETPKLCSQIVLAARSLLTDHQLEEFGETDEAAEDKVKAFEEILLKTIKFDLHVEHPYNFLLQYAKRLKGDVQKITELVQLAWTFINDSFRSTLSLQWESEIIAIALMHSAGKKTNFQITDWCGKTPNHTNWWDMFIEDVSVDLFEDIFRQVCYVPIKSKDELRPESPLVNPPLPPPVEKPPSPPPLPPPASPEQRPPSPPPMTSETSESQVQTYPPANNLVQYVNPQVPYCGPYYFQGHYYNLGYSNGLGYYNMPYVPCQGYPYGLPMQYVYPPPSQISGTNCSSGQTFLNSNQQNWRG